MFERLNQLYRETRLAISQPREQLSRGQRFIRFSIDLARHARSELRDDSATTLAAALTYRTIFGLVPMIVMALIVFSTLGGFSDSERGLTDMIYEVLEIDESFAVESGPEAEENESAPLKNVHGEESNTGILRSTYDDLLNAGITHQEKLEANPEYKRDIENEQMRLRIDGFIDGLSSRASGINLGSIGVVGSLILIWAALGLIVTVEKTFNIIFKAPQGRAWHVRIPIYWAIITLGPVLIWASLYLSTRLVEASETIQIVGSLVGWLNRFMALLVTWLLFLLLFKLMPNTKVAIRPAMIGAMVSALAWEGMKAGLRWFINNAVINQTNIDLYGSLALVPLVLFFIYLTWIVVLAGLEVTQILQTLPAGRMGDLDALHGRTGQSKAAARDPWLVIPVMSAVAEAFERGETTYVDEVADRLCEPHAAVMQLVDALTQRGLLHQIPQDEGPPALSLALPPDKIKINDLIASASTMQDKTMPGHALLEQIAKAQNDALADATLQSSSDSAPARRRGGDG